MWSLRKTHLHADDQKPDVNGPEYDQNQDKIQELVHVNITGCS